MNANVTTNRKQHLAPTIILTYQETTTTNQQSSIFISANRELTDIGYKIFIKRCIEKLLEEL